MKKGIMLLAALFVLSALSPAEDLATIAQSVENIEAEYQQLLANEAQKREEFMAEKAQLEQELAALKEKEIGKEKFLEKLQRDSQIRWHREEYKKLLNRYDVYYEKLTQKIADTEQKIMEVTKLLEIMQ